MKDLFEEFKSNFQFNQFFGYIEFDIVKKKYIFRFVNSINSKVSKATIANTGQKQMMQPEQEYARIPL